MKKTITFDLFKITAPLEHQDHQDQVSIVEVVAIQSAPQLSPRRSSLLCVIEQLLTDRIVIRLPRVLNVDVTKVNANFNANGFSN